MFNSYFDKTRRYFPRYPEPKIDCLNIGTEKRYPIPSRGVFVCDNSEAYFLLELVYSKPLVGPIQDDLFDDCLIGFWGPPTDATAKARFALAERKPGVLREGNAGSLEMLVIRNDGNPLGRGGSFCSLFTALSVLRSIRRMLNCEMCLAKFPSSD